VKFETARQLVIKEQLALPFGFLYSLQTAAAINFALLSAKFCPRHFLSCACFVDAVEFTLLVWVALLAVIAAKFYERF